MRIEHNIDRAGVLILKQNFLPSLTAIRGAKNAALGVGSKGVPEGRNQNDVRIAPVDDDRSDVAGVLEADVPPRPTRVGRFVHAVTVGNVSAQAGLTAACVKNVGIGVGHRNGSDGRDALVIEHRSPTEATVGTLENSASDGAPAI